MASDYPFSIDFDGLKYQMQDISEFQKHSQKEDIRCQNASNLLHEF